MFVRARRASFVLINLFISCFSIRFSNWLHSRHGPKINITSFFLFLSLSLSIDECGCMPRFTFWFSLLTWEHLQTICQPYLIMIQISNVILSSCWIVKQKFDIWLCRSGQLKFNISNELRTMDPDYLHTVWAVGSNRPSKFVEKLTNFQINVSVCVCIDGYVQFIPIKKRSQNEKFAVFAHSTCFASFHRINFMRIHLRISAFYLAHGPNGVHIKSFFLVTVDTVNGINASIALR